MSLPGWRARFHYYGPWVVGLGAILAAIAYELAQHHLISRDQALFFVALVPSIVLHEMSHGVVAYWCGDDTAKRAGRLSPNPLRHIDPIGTVLLPILLIITTGRAFGWAKPVPIQLDRLRHPRNQAVLVGLAGPLTNIILALAAGFTLRLLTHNLTSLPFTGPSQWPIGYDLLAVFGEANAIIAAFNLIPIPPLDGSAVVERLLPAAALPGYYRLRSSMIILVMLVVFLAPGVLADLLNWAVRLWADCVFFT